MGRASSTSNKKNAKGSKGSVKKASKTAKEDKDFKTICRLVFNEADRNSNGKLDNGEFWYVLESAQLNLNLSKEEISEIRRLAESDGPLPAISYEQFVPMFRSLLSRVYAHNDNDWNDWCVCTDPRTGNEYYLNKRTGQSQKDKPENFNAERVEEQSFEYVTLDDGMELTTTIGADGVRMYMDWDSQEWRELPSDWLKDGTVKTDFRRGQTNVNMTDSDDEDAGGQAASPAKDQPSENVADPRVGEYQHPSRGLMHTYLFENTRNTRIYYDNRVSNWARMPLGWERNVKEVKVMLDELDALLPRWKNVNEQMLTLRECNYDLQDAIVFAEINWGYKPGTSSVQTKLERQQTRAGFGDQAEEDLGVLSKAAANKIHDLELKLSEAQKRIDVLEKDRADEAEVSTRRLKRENTKMGGALSRQDRRLEEATELITELTNKVQQVQNEMSEKERELVACQADSEKISTLENQLRTMQQGGGEAAASMKKMQTDSERMRTENTHLKMKVMQMKEQLETPVKSQATRNLLGKLLTQVQQIKQEKDALSKQYQQQNSQVQLVLDKAYNHSKGLGLAVNQRVEDITTKYRAEVLQRKLLYNKLQEMRGNIRVFLRVRRDTREAAQGPAIFEFPSEAEVIVKNLVGSKTTFDFDRVFSPQATQEDVFRDTKAVIVSVLDGYKVCLMAYGQTGSGKSYTMSGPKDNPGVNTRAVTELLKLCNEDDKLKVEIKASMCEVYNENVYDLLTAKRTPRKLKTGINGVHAEGLLERPVTTIEDVHSMMRDCDKNRSVAATSMNTDSSRSHLIFVIKVEIYNSISGVTSLGRLTLVDLAGSERIARSEATGERLVEAAAINKSLSALGQVFQAIGASSPHVPYRNSKLTHLLQDSLGGDSKTCMFIASSPLEVNLSETHSTLNFGKQIRKIELGPAKKNQKKGGAPPPPSF